MNSRGPAASCGRDAADSQTASECLPSFVIKLRHYRWLSRHPDAPLHHGDPSHDSADALHGLAKQLAGSLRSSSKRDAAVSDCCGAEELPPALPAVRCIAATRAVQPKRSCEAC